MPDETMENEVLFANPMEQGSDAWHDHRAIHRNASEAPAVMADNRFFPHTPYELFQVKTGIEHVEQNAAMRRGNIYEDEAREFFEERIGDAFRPHVVTKGIYSASLDGVNFDGTEGLEIKVPSSGMGSDIAKLVLDEGSCGHYYAQVQHQIYTANLEGTWFGVYDPEGGDGEVVWIPRNVEYIEELKSAWDSFAESLSNGSAPEMTNRDTAEREDDEWAEAAEEARRAKEAVEHANQRLADAKQRLVELSNHPKTRGSGVTLTRVIKAGSVSYAKACQDHGLDLSEYRGEPSATWQLRTN